MPAIKADVIPRSADLFSKEPKASQSRARKVLALALATLMGGCTTLPRSGPTAHQIVDADKEEAARLGFQVIDVSSEVVASLNSARSGGLEVLASLPSVGEIDRIGVGDELSISIFEVGAPLFGRGDSAAQLGASSTGASTATLPAVTVGRDGFVDLPFIGRVQAVGLAPQDLQAVIRRRLRPISQNAQVIVSIHDNLSNTVVISGSVKKPGRFRLSLIKPRLLDILADAGGAAYEPQDILVRVTRGDKRREMMLSDIQSGQPADLAMLPGDRVELLHSPRTFTAFGATQKVAEIPFDHDHLSLAQAVARVGGPSEAQADPTGVFLFRYERKDSGERPIIYRLNMMRPSSYFLAQNFMMKNGDVLYVANARASQTIKFVQVLSILFQPIYGAKILSQ